MLPFFTQPLSVCFVSQGEAINSAIRRLCSLSQPPPPPRFFSIMFFPHVTLLTVTGGGDKSHLGLSGQRTEESYSTFIYLSIFPFIVPHFPHSTLNKRKLQLPSCVFSQKVLGFPQTVSQAVILTGGYFSLIPSPSLLTRIRRQELGLHDYDKKHNCRLFPLDCNCDY